MAQPLKTEEIAEVIRGIRERVRARYPGGATPDQFQVPLADLMPVVRTRDAALSKVASIGKVNPRHGGPVNTAVQALKRLVARALDWHVREQVEFNRHLVSCVDALIEALNESNRALVALSGRLVEVDSRAQGAIEEARELKDIREHWAEWRQEWERKLFVNETQFLRSVADLQAAFTHRATLMEANFRDIARSQHADYLGALDRTTLDLQKRFWSEVEKVKIEYERMIHEELRILRQRAGRMQAAAPPPAREDEFDYGRFAERFRGPEEYVRKSIQVYLSHFEGRRAVLDVGCGRGEFLEMLKTAGVPARGVELSEECVATCREKGLEVYRADLFEYLSSLADGTLDGVFCAQVVEHLPPPKLPELIRLAAAKLRSGGLLAIETPNPECLAIFATHFYLDPTHTRPVPSPLAVFYFEEAGFGNLKVLRLAPAIDTMPALAELPEAFRDAFFGALDYAILGTKL